jgi:hypothetical protein
MTVGESVTAVQYLVSLSYLPHIPISTAPLVRARQCQ